MAYVHRFEEVVTLAKFAGPEEPATAISLRQVPHSLQRLEAGTNVTSDSDQLARLRSQRLHAESAADRQLRRIRLSHRSPPTAAVVGRTGRPGCRWPGPARRPPIRPSRH